MTIAAAYLTSNGVVLGADSTTTVKQQGQVVQLLHHAQKVFEVGQCGRMGCCTFGAGRIAETSHRTILARLGDWVKDQTIKECADKLADMVNESASKAGGLTDAVGYFIGGRNLDRTPACCRVYLDPHNPPSIMELKIGDARFEGVPNVFTRVFHGFDPQLPKAILTALAEELKPDYETALPKAELEDRFNKAFQKIMPQFGAIGFPDLPIREAIDFIFAYLHVTIKAYKFRYGAPPCGGPIEIAFVTTDRPFRWANHKLFGAAILEHSPTFRRPHDGQD